MVIIAQVYSECAMPGLRLADRPLPLPVAGGHVRALCEEEHRRIVNDDGPTTAVRDDVDAFCACSFSIG
jgi:hypothetical protein